MGQEIQIKYNLASIFQTRNTIKWHYNIDPFKDNPQSWFIDAWVFHIVVHLNSNAYLDDFGPIKQGCLTSKYH
jgi:hypothetical protein